MSSLSDKAPPRILFFEQDATAGGSSRSLREYLSAIDRTRYRPLIVFGARNSIRNWKGDAAECLAEENIAGFENNDFAPPLLTSIRGLYSLLRWVAHFPLDLCRILFWIRKAQPDLMHINNGQALTAGIAAKMAGVPVVWHIREMTRPNILSRFQQYIYRHCAKRLITVSKAVAERLPECKTLCTVMFNPVHVTPACTDDIARFREEHNIPDQAFAVLLPANPSIEKGYLFLADVADKLKNDAGFIFVLAGSMEEKPGGIAHRLLREIYRTLKHTPGEKQIIQQRWKSLMASRRAVFTGNVDSAIAIAACTLVVCPTLHSEPFGRTVIEAYAQHTPVLTAAAPAFPEIIEDNQTGWLLPLHAEHWAVFLKTLSAKPEERRRVAENGFKRLKRFDAHEYAVRMTTLYGSLIEPETREPHP